LDVSAVSNPLVAITLLKRSRSTALYAAHFVACVGSAAAIPGMRVDMIRRKKAYWSVTDTSYDAFLFERLNQPFTD
jgi:hypothetical protein